MGARAASPPTFVRMALTWFTIVLATVSVSLGDGAPVAAQVDPSQWGLTSFCTPSQDFPAFRRFRVRNSTGVAQPATLRNQTNGQTSSFTAPAGDSFQLVPANANPTSANTTQLIVGGVTVAVKAANNRACSTLVGNAVCNTSIGAYDITWTMRNNGTGPVTITASSISGLAFAPNPVAASGTATATEQVPGPATGTVERTLTLTVDLGSSVIGNPTATVTLGTCERPVPPRIDFTFTKTPSVTEADVGDVVTYTYAGTNTGEVPLEVTQLVDDTLGVLISDPTVETIVPPGGTISRDVTYTITSADGTIGRVDNSAVVTVVPRSGPDQQPRTGTAQATVVVRPPPSPTLVANQVCDPDVPGQATVTWTLANGGPGPAVILGSTRPGVLGSGIVAPGDQLTATEVVATPPAGETTTISLTVTVRAAAPVTQTVTVPACLEPTTTFTFTKTPDVTTAAPGDVVTYTFFGTNLGTATLEVLQLVDDRLGVLIEDPSVETLVPPGESISRDVTYTVTATDQSIGSIDNTAVVTVRPTSGPNQDPRTGVAEATVTVPPPPPSPVPALAGTALCIPDDAGFDITWTLSNAGTGAAVVTAVSRPGTFTVGATVPPGGGSLDAVESVPAPATGTETVELVVDIAGVAPVSASLVLGGCAVPPEPQPQFSFTKTADLAATAVGETVTYTYSGTNTGTIALEVTQLVDDRLGVVIYDPDVRTVVEPGESITRQVTYVVDGDDASIGEILNVAVATVIPDGSVEPLTASADVTVLVAAIPDPVDPTDPTTTTTSPTTTTPAASSTTTTSGAGGSLPATGADSSRVASWAAAIIAIGVLALAATRRRAP